MPFYSAYDLRVSSAAKELVMPTPIRAAQSAIPEKGNLVLIVTPLISLIQAPIYKIIKKRAGRCKLTETKSSVFFGVFLLENAFFVLFSQTLLYIRCYETFFRCILCMCLFCHGAYRLR